MDNEPAESSAPRKPPSLQSIASELSLSDVTVEVIEKGLESSSPENVEKALDEVIEALFRTMDAEEPAVLKVSSVLNFLKSVSTWENFGRRHLVQNMVTAFTDKILSENTHHSWKTCMIQIVTKFVQTTHYNEHSQAGLSLLEYLLSVALAKDKHPTAADIKRIKDLKEFILALEILDSRSARALTLFREALVSEVFLKSKEGVVVLAYFFSKEKTLVKPLQAIVRNKLATFSKNVAGAFGDLYFHSWILADGTPTQEEIEMWAIQDIMVRVMTLNRPGLKMSRLGTNAFQILKAIRSHRKSKKFSGVVTKLYQPIIWRSLKSHNPLERCNATQVFFDVFPLEKVNEGTYENRLFKDKQVKEIKDLLVDECPYVRVLAIRGVGSVFLYSAELLGVTDFSDLMKILTEKLTFDLSSPHVRAEVFNMFESIIASPTARPIVISMMKRLPAHLFDVSKEVRKSYAKVLLKWSETDEPDSPTPSVWDVVPYQFILECLAAETEREVGALLAKLVLPNVYKKNQPVKKTIKRFVKIIEVSPMALMKCFKMGKNLVDVEDAFTMIASVIATLGVEVGQRMEELARRSEEIENADAPGSPRHKKRKTDTPLKDITATADPNVEEPQADVGAQEPRLLDDHEVVMGILNGVSALWAAHSAELEKSSQRELLCKLAIAQVPRFAKYFKGTPVYYTVVSFASLLPAQDVSKQSTIIGASISELKQMNVDSDMEIMNCLVTALCFWSRSGEIIDLAMDWLNETFRREDLNTTAILARENKKQRSVRFKPESGKPMLAFRILRHIFQHVGLRSMVLAHDYEQLAELFQLLGRIKDLVERRIDRGEPWSVDELSDQVLLECVGVYLSMISMLHRPDGSPALPSGSAEPPQPSFVAPSVSVELLHWAENELFESARSENGEKGFSSKCLLAVVKNALHLIQINLTSREHCSTTLAMARKLSSFESPLPFLGVCFGIIYAACLHASAYTRNDEWKILSSVKPLIMLGLQHLSEVEQNEIKSAVEDHSSIPKSIESVLLIYFHLYGCQHQEFKELCALYVSTMVNAIVHEIDESSEAVLLSDFRDHPYVVQIITKTFLSQPALFEQLPPMLTSYFEKHKESIQEVLGCMQYTATFLYTQKSKLPARLVEDLINYVTRIWDGFQETEPEWYTIGSDMLSTLSAGIR